MDGTRKEGGKERGGSPGSLWKGRLLVRIFGLAMFTEKISQVAVPADPEEEAHGLWGPTTKDQAEVITLVPHKHKRQMLDLCISMHFLSVEKTPVSTPSFLLWRIPALLHSRLCTRNTCMLFFPSVSESQLCIKPHVLRPVTLVQVLSSTLRRKK